MRSIKHISIIGAGNVATHLGLALRSKGLNIDGVYSRKLRRAKILAKQLKSTATNKLKEINTSSHLYILAVSDDAIATVSKKMSKVLPSSAWVVHTSGSVSSSSINFDNRGVFYPLQSFSIERAIDFKEVPFCIFSESESMQKKLLALARKFSKSVQVVNDNERAVLHLAAVFSSNFSNHMYHIANQICTESNIDFDILKPLIQETANKLNSGSPHKMQTGPARRDDIVTLQKHIKQLSKQPKHKAIYKLISESIKNSYQ